MKILHVAQPTEAGVGQIVLDLVKRQQPRGWDIAVACPPGTWLSEAAQRAGVTTLPWPAVRSPNMSLLAEVWRLAGLVRRFDPNVVHLHSSKAGLAGRLAIRGRRASIFQPNAWSFDATTGIVRGLAIAWERSATRWTHAVVCVSEGECQKGKSQGINARWRVIPNGIDPLGFPEPASQHQDSLRQELGLPSAPIVVCVGRLCRQKGQDVLLRAWPWVKDSLRSALLVLVGDGPSREELEKGAQEGVIFVGHQTDVRPWLTAADMVAIPSRWEGMSLVMLEAMACGRCVVSTDVPGARDALSEGAGIVVPIENERDLASNISKLLVDPRAAVTIGSNARRRVQESYDFRLTEQAMAELYREILEASTGTQALSSS